MRPDLSLQSGGWRVGMTGGGWEDKARVGLGKGVERQYPFPFPQKGLLGWLHGNPSSASFSLDCVTLCGVLGLSEGLRVFCREEAEHRTA